MQYIKTDIPLFVGVEQNSSDDSHEELSHYHNSIELIKVMDGKMNCHVDGKNFLMGKGDFCFINCGRLHRVSGSQDYRSPDCIRKVFIFDPKYLIKNDSLYKKYVQPMVEDASFSHLSFHEANPLTGEIFALVEQIEEILEEKSMAYELEIVALIHLIFRRLHMAYITHKSSVKEKFPDNNHRIQRMMTFYIYEHFADKLSLDDIALSGNVSRSKCSKLFAEYAGKSPIDFLNAYRLEVSTSLLQSTTKSIAEIAAECGFSQQSYYNRLFLREFACTPKQYRETHKGETGEEETPSFA